MHISIIIRDSSSLFPAWLSSLSTSAMSLLYECVNTVIAGELCCSDCQILKYPVVRCLIKRLIFKRFVQHCSVDFAVLWDA